MKKIFLLFTMGILGVTASAQFVDYISIDAYEQAAAAPAQVYYGYIPTSKGWVRISIQVKQSGGTCLVVAYKKKDLSKYAGMFSTYQSLDGGKDSWVRCQAAAREVNVYQDGQQIANNFDYAASLPIGTVYF